MVRLCPQCCTFFEADILHGRLGVSQAGVGETYSVQRKLSGDAGSFDSVTGCFLLLASFDHALALGCTAQVLSLHSPCRGRDSLPGVTTEGLYIGSCNAHLEEPLNLESEWKETLTVADLSLRMFWGIWIKLYKLWIPAWSQLFSLRLKWSERLFAPTLWL